MVLKNMRLQILRAHAPTLNPCRVSIRHIFKIRCVENLDLYDEVLCKPRWSLEYLAKNHRAVKNKEIQMINYQSTENFEFLSSINESGREKDVNLVYKNNLKSKTSQALLRKMT